MKTIRTIDARRAGLGDLVRALCIAEGARTVGERIAVVSGRYAPVTAAFGHEEAAEPSEDCMGVATPDATHGEELANPADPTPSVLRWQRTMGWDYPVVRPTLALPPEVAAWGRAEAGGRVLLSPRATRAGRTLPKTKWMWVAADLEARGVGTLAVDPIEAAVEGFPKVRHGTDLPHLLALIDGARAVAGCCSGVANVAAALGKPTVVAMGPTRPEIVFGPFLDVVRPVRSDRACVGCHFHYDRGYRLPCDHGCEALMTLPWETVRDAILELL